MSRLRHRAPNGALRPRCRGLTLLEVAIAIALLAILGALALPSMASRLDRQRLGAAAEALAADLNEARFEAARQGRAVHLNVVPGPAWCWAVATEAACPCGQAAACELRHATAAEHAGLAGLQGGSLVLSPQGRAESIGAITLHSRRGDTLRVELLALGRARICNDGGGKPLRPYPDC